MWFGRYTEIYRRCVVLLTVVFVVLTNVLLTGIDGLPSRQKSLSQNTRGTADLPEWLIRRASAVERVPSHIVRRLSGPHAIAFANSCQRNPAMCRKSKLSNSRRRPMFWRSKYPVSKS